jgi:hypothetical protein
LTGVRRRGARALPVSSKRGLVSDQPTSDQPTSDQPISDPPAARGEAPTTPAEAPTVAAPPEPLVATDGTPASRERLQFGAGRVAAIAVIVLLVGGGAGFFLGHSTADTGPTSLAAAAQDTAKGDLPVGDLSLDQVLGAIGRHSGNRGGGTTDLGGLLDGKGADAKDLLQQFLDQLQHSFDDPGAGSGTPSTPTTPPTTSAT